ncbi:class I SAM-dependent methyltransferase [Actinomadura scrupuli]|uniref:class I SAM-dependent methyltransferase n=1 Tax=Actinomadura scrupuli TaxID=559629 RepID=UPI003D985CB6
MTLARTKAHYETYPFLEGGPRRVARWAERLRAELPDALLSGSLVLDVGCGSGEVAQSLAGRGARVVGLDLTEAAARRTRGRGERVTACQASALALPFPSRVFDHTVSIGVLHHTPDAFRGLAEMVRVTRSGGRIVILLYARWTPYHLLYGVTAPLRRRVPVRRLDDVPPWALACLRPGVRLLIGQRLSDDQLRRLVADQIWTPRATFDGPTQIRRWARTLGVRLRARRRIFGYSNVFILERPPAPGR